MKQNERLNDNDYWQLQQKLRRNWFRRFLEWLLNL